MLVRVLTGRRPELVLGQPTGRAKAGRLGGLCPAALECARPHAVRKAGWPLYHWPLPDVPCSRKWGCASAAALGYAGSHMLGPICRARQRGLCVRPSSHRKWPRAAHRVATYSLSASPRLAMRAKPKSQSFIRPLQESSIFSGLMSRWMIWAPARSQQCGPAGGKERTHTCKSHQSVLSWSSEAAILRAS